MKKSKKLLLSTICLSSTVLVVTPVVTACSDAMKDLKIVERGNGDVFAKFKFNGEDQTITFNDALAR